jgi:polyisoprenoid-binding protein YceI
MGTGEIELATLNIGGPVKIQPIVVALAALLLVAVVPRVRAQQAVLELDPARCRVEFTLGATLHTVHGTLKLKAGTISFDQATGQASGRVVVDATSANTGNDGRDNKMHREILASEKYPEIVFTPAAVQGVLALEGSSRVQLKGKIALHGREQEVILDAQVQVVGDELTAETSFPAPYVKWGLKNPSTFLLRVKDTANLTVHVAGRLTTPQ